MASFGRTSFHRRLQAEPDDQDRWLVSYADFITLLFAFFVVMYAISSVNEGKYKVLSATLTETFRAEALTLKPIQVGSPVRSTAPSAINFREAATAVDTMQGDTFVNEDQQNLDQVFQGLFDATPQVFTSGPDWVEVNLPADVLFQPGSAKLSSAAEDQLRPVALRLELLGNPVTIEGYSDNLTVDSARFQSNWELSSARAASVIEFFVAQGLRSERFAAVGYGENHPVATNATAEGRARNRRVSIVVARTGKPGRSLNAATAGTLRRDPTQELTTPESRRTEQGGLIFSAEPAETE